MPHQDRTPRNAEMSGTGPAAKSIAAVTNDAPSAAAPAATSIDDSPYMAAQRRCIEAIFGAAAKPPVAQRRIAFRRPDGEVRTEKDEVWSFAPQVHDAILANEQSLSLLECQDSGKGQTSDEKQRAAQVLEYLKTYSRLKKLLEALQSSQADHGTIDLRDPQHLAQFYFDARRHLILTGAIQLDGESAPETVENLKEGQHADEKEGLARHLARSDASDLAHLPNAFPVAILGAGASVAYYLATEGRSLDPDSTVIIGQTQPWKEERGSTGVVNHPLHMIAPDGYQGRDLLDAEGGLAPRAALSARIEAVLKRWPHVKPLAIKEVTRDVSGHFFKITTTDDQVFHARKVIAGLGIGKHKQPDNVTWDGGQPELPANQTTGAKPVPRLMDMDRFQRAMVDDEIRVGDIRSIAVIGPNAAIDVMSTVLREYSRLRVNPIYWITGTQPGSGGRAPGTKRPYFLKGTDNEYVEGRYNEVMRNQSPSDAKRITKEGVITVVGHDYLAAQVGADGVQIQVGERGQNGGDATVVETLHADLVVYGMGPDVNAVSTIFGVEEEAIDTQMEPIYDLGLHFNQHADIDSPEALVESLTQRRTWLLAQKRLSSEDRRFSELGDEQIGKMATAVFQLLGEVTTAVRPGKEKLETNGRPPVVGVRLKPQEGGRASLEFIGGTAFRLAGKMIDRHVSSALNGVRAQGLARAVADHDGTTGSPKLHAEVGEFVDRLQRYLNVAVDLAKRLENSDDVQKAKKDAYWRGSTAEWLDLLFSSLGFCEGAASSEADREVVARLRMTYATVAVLQRQLEALYVGATTDKYASLASSHMGGVSNSLPKNVVLGDQLTAARSSVEALQSHVPPNVSDGVNLVTSDHTTIAAYLAAVHVDLPPPVADLLTARVLVDRRHAALDRAPLPRPELENNRYTEFHLQQQSDFQSKWMRLFGQVNALFK